MRRALFYSTLFIMSATATPSSAVCDANIRGAAQQCGDATTTIKPYPAFFMFHGGGPLPVLGDPAHRDLIVDWKRCVQSIVAKNGLPKAIAVVSAHYETQIPSFGSAEAPKMLYDYGGFPAESYSLKYPAPGHPELAERMKQALRDASIESRTEPNRPFDHGVFVPLMLLFPKADIPVVPISVLTSQDAGQHIAMGRALSKFRQEGVFFIGSGASMHNFKYFFSNHKGVGKTYNEALTAVLTDDKMTSADRIAKMSDVSHFAGVEESQPRGASEHLMPLLTLVGVSEGGVAKECSNVELLASNQRQYIFE